MKSFSRYAIIALSLFGLAGVGKISYAHIMGSVPCPMIGILPACYLVTLGYLLLLAAPLRREGVILFAFGIAIVLGLALVGSIGEISGIMHCPHTQTGVPKCYLSALLSLAIALLGFVYFKQGAKK